MPKDINILIESLKEHKDAVIIVGSKATTITVIDEEGNEEKVNMFFEPTEENKEIFSRKTMVKEPDKFWSFYNCSILKAFDEKSMPSAYENIIGLIGIGLIKTVIDFNCDGILEKATDNINYIPIKGNRNRLQCVRCKEYIELDNPITITSNALTHNDINCGGKIKPTIPFLNEKYDQKHITDMFKSIFKYDKDDNVIGLNTHNLILIGVDFEEDLIDNIIAGFNEFKRRENASTVFITDNEDLMMNAYEADFGTTYDISESISKLCNLL